MDSATIQRAIGLDPAPGVALLSTGLQQMEQARTRAERDLVLDSLQPMVGALAAAYHGNRDQMDRLFDSLHRAGEGVKTRCRALQSAVKRQARANGATRAAEGPNGLESAEQGVLDRLALSRSGAVKSNALNSSRILTLDSRWSERIRYNEFTGYTEVDGQRIEDRDLTTIQLWLSEHYGIEPGRDTLLHVLDSVGGAHPYHPVRDRLLSVVWDGIPRLHRFIGDYVIPKEESDLVAILGRKFWIGAVSRILQPGSKFDTVLILVGRKGIFKSTLIRKMAIEDHWFSDSYLSIGTRDADLALRGTWIRELSELEGMRKKDAATLKAWISRREDEYRRPYASTHEVWKRQCVFIGSSNEGAILNDTGNRRFWPVVVERIDLELFERDRDQLWAEAVDAYIHGSESYLETADLEDQLSEHSVQFESADPWEGAVTDYLLGKSQVQIGDLLESVLGEIGKANNGHSLRVGQILKRIGWTRTRKRVDGKRVSVWVRP